MVLFSSFFNFGSSNPDEYWSDSIVLVILLHHFQLVGIVAVFDVCNDKLVSSDSSPALEAIEVSPIDFEVIILQSGLQLSV